MQKNNQHNVKMEFGNMHKTDSILLLKNNVLIQRPE